MSDERQPEVVFFSFLDGVFAQIFGQIVSIIVTTLRNTNLGASRCFKMKKTSLPVDVQIFGQIVSIIVKTLRNTNLGASRCFKMKKTSLPVDVQIFGQIVSIIVTTLRNTNLGASRCFKMKKTSFPVDVRRSKMPLLKLPNVTVAASSRHFHSLY